VRRLAALLLACALAAFAPAAPAPVELRVHPPEINLATARDRQAVVVQAVHADGITRDVTGEVRWSLQDPALVRLRGNELEPRADGRTELALSLGTLRVVLPVVVARAGVEEPVSFLRDVMPVFTKAGCNAGGCHGASRGKDGFMLSLFGYDPEGDYQRLTREAVGRRVNLALPAESTLLEKGAGLVPHTGGERFKPDSELYRILRSWIEAGAPRDAPGGPGLVRLEIGPRQTVLSGTGTAQRLSVRAVYADGSDRDVTSLAAYVTSNDAAVRVSEAGVVSAVGRGEAFIMARYEELAAGVEVIALPEDAPAAWPALPEVNYIDARVHAKLRRLRMVPADVCDDATFLRRASLDLTGTLPKPDEVRAFLADSSPGKRAALVEALLQRPEFTELWIMKWAELLQVRSANQQVQMSARSATEYFGWIAEQVTAGVPADVMVRGLLTATGPSFEVPAANFYKVERDPLKLAENTAQAFLGVRLQCAQCHNHPFDRWTMNDYYGFAAFFAQVGRKPGEDPREAVIFNAAAGRVRHPLGGRDVPPRFLGGEAPPLPAGSDRRAALAAWLTAPENPFFARHLANVVWEHFLGAGLVDPVDDVRVSNPPANPELLDALAERLVAARFDLRSLIRDICASRTYQLSVVPNATNEHDSRNFARGRVRRIRAEVLLDAIGAVTGAPEKIRGLPAGARAVAIADGRTTNYFLTTFGRATRETPCSCEVRLEPNLSQALHLLNGDTIQGKISSGGLIRTWLREGRSREAIITELYLRTFGRFPTAAENSHLAAFFSPEAKEADVLHDLFWSLLNAKEFVFNH
jgi:hypothetical protein